MKPFLFLLFFLVLVTGACSSSVPLGGDEPGGFGPEPSLVPGSQGGENPYGGEIGTGVANPPKPQINLCEDACENVRPCDCSFSEGSEQELECEFTDEFEGYEDFCSDMIFAIEDPTEKFSSVGEKLQGLKKQPATLKEKDSFKEKTLPSFNLEATSESLSLRVMPDVLPKINGKAFLKDLDSERNP